MLPSLRNREQPLLLIRGETSSSIGSVVNPSGATGSSSARGLFQNFILFCLLYSIAHATVDGVLAYTAAELGSSVGSDGSALLYFFYTFSSLLAARPVLRAFGAKRMVFFGLMGLLCYVSTFFISILGGAKGIFLFGASLGGIGAGFLWTGQGSYYSLNARAYAQASGETDSSVALANFASIFASTYLLMETLLKMFATIIYLAKDKKGEWKSIVFGLYVTAAFFSAIYFYFMVKNLKPVMYLTEAGADVAGLGNNIKISLQEDCDVVVVDLSHGSKLTDSVRPQPPPPPPQQQQPEVRPFNRLLQDVMSVGKALCTNRRLQLLMPYQICFGLSAGFVNSYMTAKVVAVYLGDGFIGLMSAIATLTAVILAWPYARIATTYREQGKWYVMIIGGCCFLFSGLSVLCLTDAQMSSWGFLVTYFIIYGAARSAWESTNKAVVAEYFGHDEKLKDSAFAAVYFMSGLAGAFGFVFYKFMNREQLAVINTVSPLIALITYHLSHTHNPNRHDWEGLDNHESSTRDIS